MGILDRNQQIVNAILTKKAREYLSKGSPDFNIVKFALGDDEIDYTLWNSSHPSGSDYYGETIELTPIFEAMPDETISMKYKLITLPKGVTSIPYVVASPKTLTITLGQSGIINGSTLNGAPGYDDQTFGYTCILSNQAIATLEAVKSAPNQPTSITGLPSDLYDDASAVNSSYAIGLQFKLTAKDVSTINSNLRTALITIVGNESGTSDTIELTVTPPPDRNIVVS